MDGQAKDSQVIAPTDLRAGGLSINDIDMTGRLPGVLVADADVALGLYNDGRPDDGIARPPYDPLSTGQKLAGVFDVAGAMGGGYFALSKYRNEGLHVLRADIQSLDKLVSGPELHQFKTLGSSIKNSTARLAASAQDEVIALQLSKPHLFDNFAPPRGPLKGLDLKVPKYDLMNAGERAVVDRAPKLGYIAESLRRGINTSNTANFKSGMTMLTDLHKNPTAISEGLSPELSRLENLGLRVNEHAASSTITMAAESQSLLLKSIGIIGAGIATNQIIEKTLLKDSSPKALTIASDIASPFIILTELPLWAKFSVIVGAHLVARLSEYGMTKAAGKSRY